MQTGVRVTKRLGQAVFESHKGKQASICIAIVAVNSAVPLSKLTRRLCRALSIFGPALNIKSRLKSSGKALMFINGGIWNDDEDHWRAWLQLQPGQSFLVYEIEADSQPLATRWIQEADVILVAGQAGEDASLSQIEIDLRLYQQDIALPPVELILISAQNSTPTNTLSWLSNRQLRMHHHVALDLPGDWERLARMFTKRGANLVLSGGGARTFAHIGILRALEEASVPIDLIGGTSGGALVAAQYAQGWDAEKIRQTMRKSMLESGVLLDYVLPIVSIIGGKQVLRMLNDLFSEVKIEDLRIPFYCISTDLNKGQAVVHKTGVLRDAVRASISIPGLGRPHFENGQVLIDGGIVNNLPVDVMKKYNKGIVLAADVSSDDDLVVDPLHCSSEVSSWKLLWNRLNPFSHTTIRVPNLVDIIAKTMFIAGKQKADINRGMADVYLRPPVTQFGTLDYKSFDQVVEIGYQYMQQQIAEGGLLEKLHQDLSS